MPLPDRKSIARRSRAGRPYGRPAPVVVVMALIFMAAAASPAAPPAAPPVLSSSDATAPPAADPEASPAISLAPPQKARKAAPAATSTSPEALALVEKMAERQASYPKLESWQARARSTTSRMTAEWKPKSTTTS